MKKILGSVLAILLALSLIGILAACGNNGTDPDPTEAPTIETTTEVPETEDVVASVDCECEECEDCDNCECEDCECPLCEAEVDPNLNPTEVDTTTDPDATTDPDVTTTEATTAGNRFAPPANLNTLSRAEQLAYFNLVVNRVRDEQPAFRRVETLRIEDLRLSGGASVANPIIRPVVNQLMPGEPVTQETTRGQDNRGRFLSEIAPFELRNGDISSITSTRSGNNWTIRVNIIQENNPAKPTGSANARAYPIATRDEVLRDITNISSLISADVNDATLRYHSGNIVLTVNPDGQIIGTTRGFDVEAVANNVSISIISTTVTAQQTTRATYSNFVW